MSRKIDRLVAKHIMELGGPIVTTDERGVKTMHSLGELSPPHYSADISAAWEIIKKFDNQGWCIDLHADTFYVAELSQEGGPTYLGQSRDSWEMAICLAALKAVGINYE